MRAGDIDRSRDIWVYRPFTHKTEYRGKTRALAIGPRAQAILAPYLIEKADEPEAFLFSPADSLKLFQAERRKNRKSKPQPSQRNRKKPEPKRRINDQYSNDSYAQAIERAVAKYNALETKAAEHENRKPAGVPKWSPNQLRHSAGTEVRNRFGLDTAQAVLGHSSAKVTEIYAEIDFAKAVEAMREIG